MATIEFTTEELASEEWRPVAGHPITDRFRYEVSNLGRVRNMGRGKGIQHAHVIKAHAGRKRNGGERYLTLRLFGVTPPRFESVHVLVAEAFLGPRPDPPPGQAIEVNHVDGVKKNCRALNLEWSTHLANIQHSARTGLAASGDRHGTHTHPESVRRGSLNGAAKLSEADVSAIKRQLAAGHSQAAIGASFGVSQTLVGRIARGEVWRHVMTPHG